MKKTFKNIISVICLMLVCIGMTPLSEVSAASNETVKVTHVYMTVEGEEKKDVIQYVAEVESGIMTAMHLDVELEKAASGLTYKVFQYDGRSQKRYDIASSSSPSFDVDMSLLYKDIPAYLAIFRGSTLLSTTLLTIRVNQGRAETIVPAQFESEFKENLQVDMSELLPGMKFEMHPYILPITAKTYTDGRVVIGMGINSSNVSFWNNAYKGTLDQKTNIKELSDVFWSKSENKSAVKGKNMGLIVEFSGWVQGNIYTNEPMKGELTAYFGSGFAVSGQYLILTWDITVTAGAGGELDFELRYNESKSKYDQFVVDHFAITFKAGLELYGGIGLSSIASVGVYGAGSITGKDQYYPDPVIQSIVLAGECGFKVKAFSRTLFSYAIVSGSHEFVKDRVNGQNNALLNVNNIENIDGYLLGMEGGYSSLSGAISEPADSGTWYSGMKPLQSGELQGYEADEDFDHLIAENIYPDNDLQVVSTGSSAIPQMNVVFLQSDGDRANGNRARLANFYFTETDNFLSNPKWLFSTDDGTADYNPHVYRSQRSIWTGLVWQNALKEFGDNSTFEDIAGNTDLYYSRFQAGTSWYSPERITYFADENSDEDQTPDTDTDTVMTEVDQAVYDDSTSAEEAEAEEITVDEINTEVPAAEGTIADEPETEGATTEEPETEGATTEEPEAEGATTEEPETEGATTEEPEAEGATTEEPETEGATTEEPETEGATTEGPAAEGATTEEPEAEGTATEESAAEGTTTEEPEAEETKTEEPAAEGTATEEPEAEESNTEEPEAEGNKIDEQEREHTESEEKTDEKSETEGPKVFAAGARVSEDRDGNPLIVYYTNLVSDPVGIDTTVTHDIYTAHQEGNEWINEKAFSVTGAISDMEAAVFHDSEAIAVSYSILNGDKRTYVVELWQKSYNSWNKVFTRTGSGEKVVSTAKFVGAGNGANVLTWYENKILYCVRNTSYEAEKLMKDDVTIPTSDYQIYGNMAKGHIIVVGTGSKDSSENAFAIQSTNGGISWGRVGLTDISENASVSKIGIAYTYKDEPIVFYSVQNYAVNSALDMSYIGENSDVLMSSPLQGKFEGLGTGLLLGANDPRFIDTTTDLFVKARKANQSVSITDAVFTDEEGARKGRNTPITVTVENTGLYDIDTVTLFEGDNKLGDFPVDLKAGTSVEIETAVTVPSDAPDRELEFTIKASSKADTIESEHPATLGVGSISVKFLHELRYERESLVYQVTNDGFPLKHVFIYLFDEETGENFYQYGLFVPAHTTQEGMTSMIGGLWTQMGHNKIKAYLVTEEESKKAPEGTPLSEFEEILDLDSSRSIHLDGLSEIYLQDVSKAFKTTNNPAPQETAPAPAPAPSGNTSGGSRIEPVPANNGGKKEDKPSGTDDTEKEPKSDSTPQEETVPPDITPSGEQNGTGNKKSWKDYKVQLLAVAGIVLAALSLFLFFIFGKRDDDDDEEGSGEDTSKQ